MGRPRSLNPQVKVKVRAKLRCYAELNDFIPPQWRQRSFPVGFVAPAPLRHIAEGIGIPHTEIALALRNGEPVDLDCPVSDGDRLALYPLFASVAVDSASPIQLRPAGTPHFIADAHLGKLAGYLRLLGFDTLYTNDLGDQALAAIAAAEQRVLLSRDRNLLMHKAVRFGAFLHTTNAWTGVEYLERRYQLCSHAAPFSRCMKCNGLLEMVDKSTVMDQVPLAVERFQDAFWRCQGCGQVYWRGSHWQAMQQRVTALCAAYSEVD